MSLSLIQRKTNIESQDPFVDRDASAPECVPKKPFPFTTIAELNESPNRDKVEVAYYMPRRIDTDWVSSPPAQPSFVYTQREPSEVSSAPPEKRWLRWPWLLLFSLIIALLSGLIGGFIGQAIGADGSKAITAETCVTAPISLNTNTTQFVRPETNCPVRIFTAFSLPVQGHHHKV